RPVAGLTPRHRSGDSEPSRLSVCAWAAPAPASVAPAASAIVDAPARTRLLNEWRTVMVIPLLLERLRPSRWRVRPTRALYGVSLRASECYHTVRCRRHSLTPVSARVYDPHHTSRT